MKLTKSENAATRSMVADQWNLGPVKASVEPTANAPFWSAMADRWQVSPKEARRQLCANCEYFDNSPEAIANMEAVPIDAFDRDGGGRGFCEKFDFICHSLRTCQAWEGEAEQESMWKP
ncbi:MAG: hypothetical protein ACOH2M_28225 [Cypionkella sp.]